MGRILGVLCGVTALALSSGAKAVDLDFGLYGQRFTAGYVTGEFYGLAASGESTPTGVSFTVYPYYGDFSPFSEYFSAADMVTTGGFDIEDGGLASSNYSFTDVSSDSALVIDTAAGNYVGSFVGEDIYSYASDQITEGGYMTFSVSSAPEASAWSLMTLGVALSGAALRLRRRQAPAAA